MIAFDELKLEPPKAVKIGIYKYIHKKYYVHYLFGKVDI